MKFNIVPVFFNIGIDEEAWKADRLGLNGAQDKNNSDNFRILVEYVRKFKQKNYFNHISKIISFYADEYKFCSGKVPINDEALIDDLVMILKKEVTSQRNKNVDILNISSLICHKLSGKITTLIRDKSKASNFIIQV